MNERSDLERGLIAGWWIGRSETVARVMLDHYVRPRGRPSDGDPDLRGPASPDPDATWN